MYHLVRYYIVKLIIICKQSLQKVIGGILKTSVSMVILWGHWFNQSGFITSVQSDVVNIDGNEKINRVICTVPKTMVAMHIYMASMCTRGFQTSGGKHAKPSNFCEYRCQEWDSSDSLSTAHCTNILLDKVTVGTVPGNDDKGILVGCRK